MQNIQQNMQHINNQYNVNGLQTTSTPNIGLSNVSANNLLNNNIITTPQQHKPPQHQPNNNNLYQAQQTAQRSQPNMTNYTFPNIQNVQNIAALSSIPIATNNTLVTTPTYNAATNSYILQQINSTPQTMQVGLYQNANQQPTQQQTTQNTQPIMFNMYQQ